jgi:hypothetical protein
VAGVRTHVSTGCRRKILMSSYRFFYHYFRAKKAMSVHFRGKCSVVKHVVCGAPCESNYNTRQPVLVMQGFADDDRIEGDKAFIEKDKL